MYGHSLLRRAAIVAFNSIILVVLLFPLLSLTLVSFPHISRRIHEWGGFHQARERNFARIFVAEERGEEGEEGNRSEAGPKARPRGPYRRIIAKDARAVRDFVPELGKN